MIEASAPGKVILFGEHAVVYNQPAIAVPLSDVRTYARLISATGSDTPSIRIHAKDLGQDYWLHERDDRDPLALALRLTLDFFKLKITESLKLEIESQLPIASGLGSGAATTIAIIRVLTKYFNMSVNDQQASDIAFEVEKLHHGTPSGIDNSVIAFERPLYYVREETPRFFSIPNPLTLILGHCGIASSTSDVVTGVRSRWQLNRETYDDLFLAIGNVVEQSFEALSHGNHQEIGQLMNENHALLQRLEVSNTELDRLVTAARTAGALGAKLSGAGAGGFMIALVTPDQESAVKQALTASDAQHIFSTQVSG